jgi:hypothetical protein
MGIGFIMARPRKINGIFETRQLAQTMSPSLFGFGFQSHRTITVVVSTPSTVTYSDPRSGIIDLGTRLRV